MARLRDLGDWSGGNTPSKANAAYWTDGTIPWVSPKDMKVDEITSSEDRVSEAALKEGRVSLVPEGSVLVVTRSGILSHTLPVAVTNTPVTINQDLKALTPKPSVLPKYVAHALRGASRRILKECSKHGTTVASIETNALLDFKIPLVDLDEQRCIVDEIEKQFSRLDEAVANLKRVKANLKRYKAAVLKAAVEGRLVPNEAGLARHTGGRVESASDLLQRILADHRSRWDGRGRYKEPAAPRSEWQFPLPEGWVWATLGHLAYSVKDGPHYSPKYSDTGIPFISGGNVRPEGIDFSTAKFIAPELHAELSRRCKPDYGDLLYTKGGTTGIARVNTERREFNVWVHVAVLKLCSDMNPFYVQHALNSEHCYRQAQQYTHGVGNQDLGLTRMVWITIPIPPRLEQDRIVAEVDSRISIVREVEADVDANLKRAQVLRQTVLTHFLVKTN